MHIFMIGGTGLIGSEAARELLARGHTVTTLALPPLPTGAVLPPNLEIEYGNYLKMSDEEIKTRLSGCKGFVFAAGIDERFEGPPPIYDSYKKYNIDPVKRLLTLARESGVKHTVILGSYFAYFNKLWPDMELTKWHPYIRSRRDQEEVALSFADNNFAVAVLELPYIFGVQPGRKPVWVFLVEMIRGMKKVTLFPKGGTTMVTVHQVGQAVAGALERNEGGHCYPIGYYNMQWKELLTIIHRYLGCPDKKILTIPNWLFGIGIRKIMREQKKRNIEGGLNLDKFTALQCSKQYIDKSLGCEILGVESDDIEKAIGESILLCLDIIDKQVETVAMKAE
ncbi:nucleoside-diphosphate-sugar epimerase [Sphaerochaeta pleomorpha str. Grapes]|uniref:Nucleoside-diphosphate-sugar epimerase n=1 Tax=Sphaerochaeta pleomorpha (strain ATCC BAA-1885 / DSM 22778 / Grapes) TaxID=158190 RepID=G8QUV0_SPHPG|nr:NAD(P)H-binding protein [Sphaerochaeta pleomorpha]AEV28126.1 nucleoside-diphosphate-sugar epimerase [Sphaerochaeta pleomorpha str. Grapes]